ncbi:hypothetical protein [Sphingosinicella sp. BN140058]|uniref:hypothetical protein n=1 Tax=Sphingosinicella sp. BN140058 TaxID=1892855 RepID=UPI001012D36A|nr:hypothetical protein [Sphingosinicella sp. BN140058]QAY75841.1 hypothetical protein ETR14_04315 [Sphingosinicella sp. BN140058]
MQKRSHCRLRLAALAAGIATASFATPAIAQDGGCAAPSVTPKKKGFGGLLSAARGSGLLGSVMGRVRGDGNLGADLQGTARAAARRAADGAIACAEQSASAASSDAAEAETGQPTVMHQSGAPRGQRAPSVRYPHELPKPADKLAEFKAYDELARVRCFGCEGGFENEGFHGYAFNPNGARGIDVAAMMEAMAAGESRTWSGSVVKGRITKIGEEKQSGFRCMRFRLHIDRGAGSAERDKLYCWGSQNQFLPKESWIEVY